MNAFFALQLDRTRKVSFYAYREISGFLSEQQPKSVQLDQRQLSHTGSQNFFAGPDKINHFHRHFWISRLKFLEYDMFSSVQLVVIIIFTQVVLLSRKRNTFSYPFPRQTRSQTVLILSPTQVLFDSFRATERLTRHFIKFQSAYIFNLSRRIRLLPYNSSTLKRFRINKVVFLRYCRFFQEIAPNQTTSGTV